MTNPCAICRGACCRVSSGIYWPQDLPAVTADVLESWLRNRRCAIDRRMYDGDWVYFLRPQVLSGTIESCGFVEWPFHWQVSKSPCIHLTSVGCKLTYIHRPTECRTLVAAEIENNRCCPMEGYDYDDTLRVWLRHQPVVWEALTRFSGEFVNLPPNQRS